MSRTLKLFVIVLAAVAALAACRDREAEKRIAQLEGRLAELETNRAANPVNPTPAASQAETKPEGPLPAFQFPKLEHDFGTINEGDVVEHTFTFTNTGDAPLIIQGVQASCGCTAPDWSKDPIPVGGTGFVKAKFDSQGKPNINNRTVTVTANTWPKQTVLRIKAMVTPADQVKPADGPLRK
ncbi:MAG TPA: DUF1573 domain-containing protein [Cyclobacteriaceae bacterium]|nr:DUF1573 domain-containing protein [Cyclobacteriaceae bacterium]